MIFCFCHQRVAFGRSSGYILTMTVSTPPQNAADEVNLHDDAGSHNKNNLTFHSLPLVDTLFVWDFDWTIVNCNSDEYVPASFLGVDVSTHRLRTMIHRYGPTKWHDCVASLINSCMEERGCRMQDVCNVAASMPYLANVRGSLLDVNENRVHHCGQAIISDGNTVFIREFLKANSMEHFFTHGIETNIGEWNIANNLSNNDESENPTTTTSHQPLFSVVHQSTKYGGHSCKTCPPNLCKSQVLIQILSRMGKVMKDNRPRIVYIGDGENDACPAIHVLREGDVLLARVGRKPMDPNSNVGEQMDPNDDNEERDATGLASTTTTRSDFCIISTIERRQKDGLIPRCCIRTWSTGKELRSHVRDLLNETIVK